MAALVFRIVAVLWILATSYGMVIPVILSLLHIYAKALPQVGVLDNFRGFDIWQEFSFLQLVWILSSFICATALYLWSIPLGRLVARKLSS